MSQKECRFSLDKNVALCYFKIRIMSRYGKGFILSLSKEEIDQLGRWEKSVALLLLGLLKDDRLYVRSDGELTELKTVSLFKMSNGSTGGFIFEI